MATENLVEPREGATPPAETEATPAPEQGAAKLPKDLLSIPAVRGLVAGAPAAISAPLTDFAKLEEAKKLIEHKDVLLKAGMGLYRSLDGQTGVIFNALYVHPEQIKQADQAGQLLQVAPPFTAVNQELAKAGADHPSLTRTEPPKGAPVAPVATPPTAQAPAQAPAAPASSGGPSAAAQRKLMTARVTNMQPGSPTSGASPGAGRLLNSVLKPVI